MVARVLTAQEQLTQVQEGLQQIYQLIIRIFRMMGALEGFGETIDCTQESINHMASTLNTVETAVAQLIHMTLRIRTAVAALAHRANPA
eukprot:904213-Pyramimonas_sp.AAC.1